jgi:excisionase family DNA binding protein
VSEPASDNSNQHQSAFPLLTRKQVAEYLSVSIESVSVFVHAGDLSCSKLSPRVWRFRREDVDTFVRDKIENKPKVKTAQRTTNAPRKITEKVGQKQTRAEIARELRMLD